MTEQKFTSNRGGKREGAGRKKNEHPTVVFYARVTPEQKKLLEIYLDELKNSNK